MIYAAELLSEIAIYGFLGRISWLQQVTSKAGKQDAPQSVID